MKTEELIVTIHLIRLKLFVLAILIATISISVNAQAQAPSTGPNELSGTAVRPTFRLSDLLAQGVLNERPNTRGGSRSVPTGRFASAAGPPFNIASAAGPGLPVTGSGTIGRLTKWAGFTSSNSAIGDSTIYEDKNGKVGIGTDSPASRLSVAGIIESLSGGFKFPDGSVQNTSAAGALLSITHDATLADDGTAASPLQVASPLNIRDQDNPARQPFQAEAACSTTIDGCSAVISGPPTGKRLVIEFVSLKSDIPTRQVMTFQIDTTADGQFVLHDLGLSLPAVAFGFVGRAVVLQQVRLYADPTTPIHVSGGRNGSGSLVHFSFSISGYLVDLP